MPQNLNHIRFELGQWNTLVVYLCWKARIICAEEESHDSDIGI